MRLVAVVKVKAERLEFDEKHNSQWVPITSWTIAFDASEDRSGWAMVHGTYLPGSSHYEFELYQVPALVLSRPSMVAENQAPQFIR
jgi:hypothetical protein